MSFWKTFFSVDEFFCTVEIKYMHDISVGTLGIDGVLGQLGVLSHFSF